MFMFINLTVIVILIFWEMLYTTIMILIIEIIVISIGAGMVYGVYFTIETWF
jgi:hypothetical protein